jgi:diguanylate cyclase (GGDEF)-like protein
MVLDPAGRLVGASRALSRLLGRPLEDALGTVLADLADDRTRSVVSGAVVGVVSDSRPRSVEARLVGADGGTVPVSLTLVDLVDDPAVAGIVVSATEIGELVAARAELEHRATHDALTGLPGRALLRDRLGHALALAGRRGTRVAVVFCDVDRFKQVNDRFGHAGGDEVLVEVARRLDDVARAADTVARLGGDEFCVVAEDADERLATSLRERIAEAFHRPVRLDSGTELAVGVSVGVALVDPDVGVDGALARADVAMYETKRSRGEAAGA